MCFRCMRRGGGGGMSTATPSIMDEDMSSSIMEDESIMDDETDLDTEVQSIASETHNTVLVLLIAKIQLKEKFLT